MSKRVTGLHFNSAPHPVFLEGRQVGGHEYVWIDGFIRVPGHFILINDPSEREDAPESFRKAYAEMVAAGKAQSKDVHENSTTEKANIIIEPEVQEEAPKEEEKPKTKRSRKSKRDTTSDEA